MLWIRNNNWIIILTKTQSKSNSPKRILKITNLIPISILLVDDPITKKIQVWMISLDDWSAIYMMILPSLQILWKTWKIKSIFFSRLEAEGKIAKSDAKLLNFLCPRKLDYEFLIWFDGKVARLDCWNFIWECVNFEVHDWSLIFHIFQRD